jgi:hypothetical protein
MGATFGNPSDIKKIERAQAEMAKFLHGEKSYGEIDRDVLKRMFDSIVWHTQGLKEITIEKRFGRWGMTFLIPELQKSGLIVHVDDPPRWEAKCHQKVKISL